MTYCAVAGDSVVSMSAKNELTDCQARQKSAARVQGLARILLIYKKNVQDLMNSEVFVGRFLLMTLD